MKPRTVLLAASASATAGLAVGFIYGWVAGDQIDLYRSSKRRK